MTNLEILNRLRLFIRGYAVLLVIVFFLQASKIPGNTICSLVALTAICLVLCLLIVVLPSLLRARGHGYIWETLPDALHRCSSEREHA